MNVRFGNRYEFQFQLAGNRQRPWDGVARSGGPNPVRDLQLDVMEGFQTAGVEADYSLGSCYEIVTNGPDEQTLDLERNVAQQVREEVEQTWTEKTSALWNKQEMRNFIEAVVDHLTFMQVYPERHARLEGQRNALSALLKKTRGNVLDLLRPENIALMKANGVDDALTHKEQLDRKADLETSFRIMSSTPPEVMLVKYEPTGDKNKPFRVTNMDALLARVKGTPRA